VFRVPDEEQQPEPAVTMVGAWNTGPVLPLPQIAGTSRR
jgi:hypothetical protein